MTYQPLSAQERKYQGPRFRGEAGAYFGHHWVPELALLADQHRPPLPETRPDDEAADHQWGCGCTVCARPGAAQLKRRRLHRQIRSASAMASSG